MNLILMFLSFWFCCEMRQRGLTLRFSGGVQRRPLEPVVMQASLRPQGPMAWSRSRTGGTPRGSRALRRSSRESR
jgi:hypothetical protein